MTKKVALLVGGWSAEREVSLFKGEHVERALKESGYEVLVIEVTRDIAHLVTQLTAFKPDAVFNNLYGRGGEDGVVQGILEAMEIPYTHSNVMASAVAMDKPTTKKIASAVGIQCAKGRVASKDDVLSEQVMPRPYVVKPLNEGSSFGVKIILENDNQKPLDAQSWTFGDEVLVEEYIDGREIHVTVLDGKAQDVTEIIVPGRFFDYDAKYDSAETELVTPADIPADIREAAMDNAAKIYKELGCAGVARCDFIYDVSKTGKDGVYFLEINTMPGLSPGSVAVLQPELHGISYVQLCSHLVETAKCYGLVESQNEKVKLSNEEAQKQSA
jgi:D-alanine-D-alanine ligase